MIRVRSRSLPRRIRPLGLLVAALIVAGATYLMPRAGPPATAVTAPHEARVSASIAIPDPQAPAAEDSVARIERAIGVWTANLRDDPSDFLSATQLSLDYYQRGRITGDVDDYVRAEQATATALSAYPGYGPADELNAVLAYTTHDFAGALATARRLYAADRADTSALTTIGDAELELGEYTEAAATYAVLKTRAPGPGVTARLAHVAALNGDPARADELAGEAASEARAQGVSGPSLAWYDYLVGYLAFANGELVASDSAYSRALADWPGSYLALSGLAKTRAAEGRLSNAIDLEKRAIAIVPQPQFVADLGDFYGRSGRADLAAKQYATVQAIGGLAAATGQVYNRQLVLFDVNHDVNLDQALRLADAELAVRKDIYGYDADAWALLAVGRAAEAEAVMGHALALGTRDPLLLYHAGMIAAALEQPARAAMLLRSSLEINAGFDVLQAERARAVLAGLPLPGVVSGATPPR